MPETSRDCIVVLLDETTFTVPVKPTLRASELLDMAASHCKVKEKEFFGLFTEGDGFKNWLELDKPVLDPSQDLPKGTQAAKIHFSFKYFLDDLRYFQDFMTAELLYLYSRQAIMKGDILTDDATLFELAACAMQAQHGDYRSESEALQQLKVLPVLPAHTFKANSIHYCEGEVVRYYRMMQNLSRGEALFKYLEIIQSLPMYTMHYFEVKDKKDTPMWLGVGPDGISQSAHNNRNDTELRFQWLQLQNIYYRDRKFSMEVYQNKKPSKKGVGFGPVTILAWYGINSKVVMAIWKMARDQHVFYRQRRANKNPHLPTLHVTEIIRQLNKLHANVSPSSSHSSLSVESAKSNQTQASAEAVAAAKAAQHEMYAALLARRSALHQDFERKLARFKEILIKEMQITGIPPEGLTAEEIERMRKKFGVSFKFSKFVLDDSMMDGDSEVERLEKQLEVQSSIIEASKTLLNQTSNRRLKKDRKKEIKSAEEKLQKLEGKIHELKQSKRGSTSSAKFHVDSPTGGLSILSVPGSVPSSRRKSSTPTGSVDDTYLASMIFDTPATKPAQHHPNMQKSPLHKSTSALNDIQSSQQHHTQQPQHISAPRQTPLSATQSFVYHKQSFSSIHSDRSFTSDYGDSPSYLSSVGFTDDLDLSPPSSIVSANTSTVSHNTRRPENSFRESDLTEEYLHHFSKEKRDTFSPPPGNRAAPPPPGNRVAPPPPVHFSPRQSNAEPGSDFHLHVPQTSSPVSRFRRAPSPELVSCYKRGSSPDVSLHTDHPGGGCPHRLAASNRFHRGSSPDLYLPEPDDYQVYSSSYHPPSNFGLGAQRNSTPPRHKPAYGVPANPNWYVGETEMRQPVQNPANGVPDPNHQPGPVPGSQRPMPRKPSEERYDLQEMLKIWAESSKNPFGEGTLV